MNDDALAGRRRASEEDYFRKRDNQLIEQLRIRAEREAERQRMSELLGVADQHLLRTLEGLGFSGETVPLLHIVPLVHIAWVDGMVSTNASNHIIDAAREHGIEEGSAADRRLSEWLGSRLPPGFCSEALHALSAVLQQRPATERRRCIHNLIERCVAVAAASGGILGFRNISKLERNELDQIGRALEQTAGPAPFSD
jgi:hypothetical protein